MEMEIVEVMVMAFMIPWAIFAVGGIIFTTERAISVTRVKAFTMREDTIALGAKASMTHMGIWSTPIEKLL